MYFYIKLHTILVLKISIKFYFLVFEGRSVL